MNYRHIYHAGNFADVIKHLLLIQVIQRLKTKETPFFALDTHAGVGMYDLTSEQAQKTKEAELGIQALFAGDVQNQDIRDYVELVKKFNEAGQLRYYPGSPVVASLLMRYEDRLIANELHSEDQETLALNLKKLPNRVITTRIDAYQALRANLPPKERRGFVLIDPPFEEKDEFPKLTKHLHDALKRWHNGTFVIWFPIKAHLPIEQFYKDIVALNAPKTLLIECWIEDKKVKEKLTGCGLVVMNTPYQVDERMKAMAIELADYICPDDAPGIEIKWLVKPVEL
jgi:23S rRNA (adenine2030-N6)-methyltransferase